MGLKILASGLVGTATVEAASTPGEVLFWDGSKWVCTETSELFWDDVNKRLGIGTSSPDGVLHLTGVNAGVELEDDSGNLSRVKSGNSQLTISADPDDAIPSTDIVFDMDGAEVARFQQGGEFRVLDAIIAKKGFAAQLWDIAGGHWETAVVNTEYYSPVQHGGIYGTIYRQYFNTSLSSTSPRLDTGSRVVKMVDFVLHTKYTGDDRGVAHGNMTAYGSSDNHAYIMLSGASGGGNISFALTGYSVLTGWVDYTK